MKNEKIALEILDEIDRARGGSLTLEELEQRIWRLLDQTGPDFPQILAGKAENLVQSIRDLQRENLSMGGSRQIDENRGVDAVYHEVSAALGRYVG